MQKPLLEHPKGVEILAPYGLVDARLCEDVGSLIVRRACNETEYLVVVSLIEPRDINPLGTRHVSHIRVVSGDDYSACGFIVLKDADWLWDRCVIFYLTLAYDRV